MAKPVKKVDAVAKKIVDKIVAKKVTGEPEKIPKVTFNPKSVKEIKAAAYNPRTITKAQLRGLVDSYEEFGDLSGVVVNVRTKTLISGHQRMKVIGDRKTVIEKKLVVDKSGTVATGFIVVPARGITKEIRVPYREVNWNLDKEMAANISANAAGGDFDRVKLGKVLAKLEKSQFEIETIAIDTYELKKAAVALKSSRKSGNEVDEKGSFKNVDLKELATSFKHKCPNCQYRF